MITATDIVRILLEPPGTLDEATVRRPPRSHRWVAVYTGVDPGMQVTRSTGLTDREAALAKAREWEVQASAERAHRRARGGRIEVLGAGRIGLSQAEVALVLGISERAVRAIERRALLKLRRMKIVRDLFTDFGPPPSTVHEDSEELTPDEIAALFSLVRNDFERRVLLKVLFLAWMED